MSKFKAGDIVKCIENHSRLKKGGVYIVLAELGFGVIKLAAGPGRASYHLVEHFTLAPTAKKFKVGDIVTCIKGGGLTHKGHTYVVLGVPDGDTIKIAADYGYIRYRKASYFNKAGETKCKWK